MLYALQYVILQLAHHYLNLRTRTASGFQHKLLQRKEWDSGCNYLPKIFHFEFCSLFCGLFFFLFFLSVLCKQRVMEYPNELQNRFHIKFNPSTEEI